jgi:hypothetical protein
MKLYDYLNKNLSRTDPTPAIDFGIRAEKHQYGRISFYIHADGRDSDTEDYWVEGNSLKEKRLAHEPLPESVRSKVLAVANRFGAFWGFGNKNALCVPIPKGHDWKTIVDWIETVEGVTANYSGTEGDQYLVFRPAFGNIFAVDVNQPVAALALKEGNAP